MPDRRVIVLRIIAAGVTETEGAVFECCNLKRLVFNVNNDPHLSKSVYVKSVCYKTVEFNVLFSHKFIFCIYSRAKRSCVRNNGIITSV